MDERARVYSLLRERFPQTKKPKLDQLADIWMRGERNVSQILREIGWAKSYHGKVSKALKYVKAETDKHDQLKTDMARKYIDSEVMAPIAQSVSVPPANIAPTPEVELIGANPGESIKLLSGPAYLEKIDKLLLEALSGDSSERSIKILHDIRKDLADFAAEMPVTHMDIERTVGLEGLAGMDQVLVETLSLFFEDIDHYPRCFRFLCDTFNVTQEDFAAKFGGAVNSPVIVANPENGPA